MTAEPLPYIDVFLGSELQEPRIDPIGEEP